MKYLFALALFLTMAGELCAQDQGDFPVPFGPTNVGKEFFFSLPANYQDPQAMTQYIRLYITSAVKTKVRIRTSVGELRKELTTKANDIITYDLTRFEAQAVTRPNTAPVPDDQLYVKKGVHVESDAPIVLYVMNRTSFTSDGALLLPVNGLGKEYVVASATDVATGPGDLRLPSQYVITAAYDSTTVTIRHATGTPNHSAGEEFTVEMNRLDVFSSMTDQLGGDHSGTVITANKPIAVMAGEECSFLPNAQFRACDHITEMMLPINAWGKHYHAMPFATRIKGDLFRIFASEPNTKIFVNGLELGTVPARGGALGVGWLELILPTRQPMEFSSDKPIYVAQYNNSQTYDAIESDPFYLVLTPMEQYQTEFLFTTPSNDYPRNFINIVSDSLALGEIEITPAGSDTWKKLVKEMGAGFSTFPTKVEGETFVGKSFEIAPGAYRMRGPRPFAAYIYGFGTYDSYGYPLSASVSDLTRDDDDPPIIASESDSEGTVEGTTSDRPEDEEKRSNLSSIWTVADTTVTYNYKLTVDSTFVPGDRSAPFTLRVIDRSRDAQAVLVIADRSGNVTFDTVNYTGVPTTTGVPGESGAERLSGLQEISPNPSNGSMLTMRYIVTGREAVTISLFDAAGKRAATLLREEHPEPGDHAVTVSLGDLPAGVYHCRMRAGESVSERRVVIVR